jgi:hypothetical protein
MAKEEIVSRGYTRTQLKAAFDLVADPTGWKRPINKVVPKNADLDAITEAITFYTGSIARVAKTAKGFRVSAAGYYLTIGS